MQEESPRHTMFSLIGEKPERISIVGFVDGSKKESRPYVFTQGDLKTNGSERFRAVPLLFINSARLLGHDVPDALIVYSGEIFYKDGRLDEVRLFGFYIVKESDPAGGTHLRKWATPEEPRFTIVLDKNIELHPSDRGRAHITYSEEPGGPYIEWELGANAVCTTDVEQVAIFIPADGEEDNRFSDINKYLTTSAMAKLYDEKDFHYVPIFPRLPVETIKERVLREIKLKPGDQHDARFDDPFGSHTYSFNYEQVFNHIASLLINQLDTSPASIQELADVKGTSYEAAKPIVCAFTKKAVEEHAFQAAIFFLEQAPAAMSQSLFELANDAFLKMVKDFGGSYFKSDDDLARAMNNANTFAGAVRKKRVGMPFTIGRPEGSTKRKEDQERDRAEFEQKIESVLRELVDKNPNFSKSAVARAVGLGGRTRNGNDTSLPTFKQKMKALGN